MVFKIDGKGHLQIFRNFSIDRNLPKHRSKKFTSQILSVGTATSTPFEIQAGNFIAGRSEDWTSDSDLAMMNPTPLQNNISTVFIPTPNIVIGEGIMGDPDLLTLNEMLQYTNDRYDRLVIRLKVWFYRFKKFFRSKKKQEVLEKRGINYTTLEEFFARIPFQKIEQTKELIKYYEDALLHVDKTGQVALKEKLKSILSVVRAEITLLDNDMSKYVSEEQAVELYEKVNADQKLKLTYVKNFIKIIPTDVLEIKEKADKLEIFDNYVVLHFDPNNDATNLTVEEKKAEERAKKDPILFGVIENSNKLYYIADWVDEYCDLTLEKMFNTLGDKVLEINNASVKSFIDKQKTN